MLKRSLIFLAGLMLWVGLFFWWMSQWPAAVTTRDKTEDLLWRSVTKTKNGSVVGWSRTVFHPEDTKAFVTYQKGPLLLYGQGWIPDISYGDTVDITLPGMGQWIIKSLDASAKINLKSSLFSGVLVGEGGVFLNLEQKTIINFDIDMTTQDGEKILPSFVRTGNKQSFFDLAEQKDIISPDLWSLYTTFVVRDQIKALWSVSKKDIDIMIRTFLEREPESSEGALRHDLRARNGLEEVSTLVNKIDRGDNCGPDMESCFRLLRDVINKNILVFPDVFWPIQQAVSSWTQLDPHAQQNVYSWKNIFHTYHNNLLAGDGRARIVRDKSILEMVRSGSTSANYEVWQYLTRMLSDQKLGSVYSLQIMREMIRIGETLRMAPDISADQKATLSKTAIDSLANLRNLLENAYFTKKEYLFILRSDLVDSEGKAIQADVMINDLQALINQIDKSALIQSGAGWANLQTIRWQLSWFNCIFSRNTEYMANPRVCRVTLAE